MVVLHRIFESFQLIVHLVLQLCVQQVFVLELFVQLAHVLCLVLQLLPQFLSVIAKLLEQRLVLVLLIVEFGGDQFGFGKTLLEFVDVVRVVGKL